MVEAALMTRLARSFVRLRRVALQAVDRAGLGRGERQPVGGDLLQLQEEALAGLQRLGTDAGGTVEVELIGELADEGMMVAARAPQSEIGGGGRVVAEIEQADVLQQLLDDTLVDQRYVVRTVARDRGQRREDGGEPGDQHDGRGGPTPR